MENKKHVLINGRFLTQRLTGVQRYAYELVHALGAYLSSDILPAENRISFELLVPSDLRATLQVPNIPIRRVGRLTGHAWEQIELPIFARGELLFTPCGGPPILHRNHVLTIHDAAIYACPNTFSKSYGMWYRFLYRMTAHRVRKILTVSKFSKDELVRWLHIPGECIIVTYPGNEQMLTTGSKTVLEKFGLVDKPYVFALGSMNTNKNVSSIIEATELLKDLNLTLVVSGSGNPAIFRQRSDMPRHVVYTGYVSDPELRTLYGNALCFVFPSFYEGFGFPPIEAMACGCPVIVSRSASLPEVCDEAALYCDPNNPASIADQIRLLVSNSSLRSAMITKGLKRRLDFTYQSTAQQTYDVFSKVFHDWL